MATSLDNVVLADSDRQYGTYTRGIRTIAPFLPSVTVYQIYNLPVGGGVSTLPSGTYSESTMSTSGDTLVIGSGYGQYGRVYHIVFSFSVNIFNASALGIVTCSGKNSIVALVVAAGGRVITTGLMESSIGTTAFGVVHTSQGKALFAGSSVIGLNGIATTSGSISAVTLHAIAKGIVQTSGSIPVVTFQVSATALGVTRTLGSVNSQAFSVTAAGLVTTLGSCTPPAQGGQIKCVTGSTGPGSGGSGGTAAPQNAVY